MNHKNTLATTLTLLGIFSLALLLTTPLFSAENDPSPAGGEVNGDWSVTDSRIYEDCEITLTGNLTVKDSGFLTFRNVTLKMNCTENGEFQIKVEEGGKFSIQDKDGDRNTTEDGSHITARNPDHHYIFRVKKGAEFEMRNSYISECGYREYKVEKSMGLFIESENVTIEGNNITECYRGIIFNNTFNFTVQNNIFYKGSESGNIYFSYCTYGVVRNNIFTRENVEIVLENSYFVTINDNNFSYGTINGILIKGSSNNYIINNSFYKIENMAIDFGMYDGVNSEENIIRNNKFISNNICLEIYHNHRNNRIRGNFYLNNREPFIISSPDYNITNIVENETIVNSSEAAIALYNTNNNSFYNCSIVNSEKDLFVFGSSQNNTFVNCTFLTYDVRDSSFIVVKNYLAVETLNSTGSPITDADVLIKQNGTTLYSSPGFGGTAQKTDSRGRISRLTILDRIINSGAENHKNTSVSIKKGNWQETRIINTSYSHIESFFTPGIKFEDSRVKPNNGNQDTVFNFSVTLSRITDYCTFLINGIEFNMTEDTENSYYFEKKLESGEYSYAFKTSTSLEIFYSKNFHFNVVDTIPPAAVNGICFTDKKNGSIKLEWTASVAEDFDHYEVYYSTTNFSNVSERDPEITIFQRENTSIIISNLEPEMLCFFAVTSVDSSVNVNNSVETLKVISSQLPVRIELISVNVSPENPVEGEEMIFDFTAKNTGEVGIPHLLLFLKVDGTEIFNQTHTGLYINETVLNSINWESVKGEHTVELGMVIGDKISIETFYIDVDEKKEEKNENGEENEDGFIPGFQAAVFITCIIGVFILVEFGKRE